MNQDRHAALQAAIRAGLVSATDVETARASRDPQFSVRNEAEAGGVPVVRIYGPIGGWFGVWADEFADELDQIDAEQVTLRINSPGGSVFDAVAIHNTIREHPANFDVHIDSLAASAASFVALAGDKVTMQPGAEMMIHNAWGLCIGDGAEMRSMADILDRQCRKVAGFYQAKAGGSLDDWLEAMAAETWYLGDEAVEAGLADEAITASSGDDDGDDGASNRWDLTAYGYLYQGRAEAPDPFTPKTSTSAAPGPAPDRPAADEATGTDLAAARQRLTSVAAMADAELVLATP